MDPNSSLDIFEMEQKNVIFYGGDIAIHYHPHNAHWLHLESNLSLLSTEQNLPFIPQNRLNNSIKIDFKDAFDNLNSISIQYVRFFAQEIIAPPYETPSSPYNLINLGYTAEINSDQLHNLEKITYTMGVNNLLNVRYIDHLSRLKTYEIPNPGRNIFVKLSLTI